MDNEKRILLLTEFIDKCGLSVSEIEKRIGAGEKYVMRLLAGKRQNITHKFAKRLYDEFGEIALPLLMSFNEGVEKDTSLVTLDDTGIPYYDVENFECGSPAGFGGALEVAKPDGYFQFPWLKPDGNTWCVRAHGNSMLNRADPSHSICHGAWVAMRRSNVRAIQWGEVYALATADGYIIKKLLPSDHDGMIRCVSFNEEDGYLPFDLSVSEIYDYAIIVGVATINLW